MREIKFRAKRIDNGKWEYGSYLVIEGHHLIVPFSSIVETTSDYIDAIKHARFILVDERTVCQNTGLKDKNGKEIYEGDILSHTYGGQEYKAVEFKNCAFFTGKIPLYTHHYTQLKIIGNICENPELLSNNPITND